MSDLLTQPDQHAPATDRTRADPPSRLGRLGRLRQVLATLPLLDPLPIVLVAVLYVLAGLLGLQLVMPPGHVSAVWPPAAVALAAILLGGTRVWPGILIGATLVSGMTEGTGLAGQDLASVMVSLGIGAIATLQAGLGARWVQHKGQYPNALARERDVLAFFWHGGVMAPLIGTTLMIAVMMVGGRLTVAAAPLAWVTWWLANLFGVVIFTPLVLVWLARPRRHWLGRRWMVTAPVLLTFGMAMTAVFFAARGESASARYEFEQQANVLQRSFDLKLRRTLDVLQSLASFQQASAQVTPDTFRIFTANLLVNQPGIQAVEWVPRIPAAERAGLEQQLRRTVTPDYQIVERSPGGPRHPAGMRAEYAPVAYVEPLAGNEAALGFDMLYEVRRHEMLDLARDRGAMSSSGRLHLVQDQSGQFAVMVAVPLYRHDIPHDSLNARRATLEGYFLAVLRCQDLAMVAQEGINGVGLAYRLLDASALPGEEQLYVSPGLETATQAAGWPGLFEDRASFASVASVAFGDRHWRVEVLQTPLYRASQNSVFAWLCLLPGLLLTAMVTAAALIFSGRGATLLQMVEARAQSLKLSEERFRSIFENAPVGVANVALDGTHLQVNERYCRILGYAAEELLAMTTQALAHPDHRASHVEDDQMFQRMMAGKSLRYAVQKRFLRKDGSPIWVNLSAHLICREDGAPDHFVTVLEDIDRRKEAEDRLQRLLDEQRTMLETDLVGIARFRAGRVLWANPALEAMFGYGPGAMVGLPPTALATSDAYFQTRIAKAFERFAVGETFRMEVVMVCSDGRQISVDLSGALLDQQERDSLWMFVDISARKQAEAEVVDVRAREVEAGFQIQRNLLLSDIPDTLNGAWVNWFAEPSQGLHGDFMAVTQIRPGLIKLLVGDVMGKGLHAAMVGAAMKNAFYQALAGLHAERLPQGITPGAADIVNRLHQLMTPKLIRMNCFVTLAMYVFDRDAGTLAVVNAGHTVGLLVRAEQGGAIEALEGVNLPLGVDEGEVYAERQWPIGGRDQLLVYSDGISEVRSPAGEEFGLERITQWLRTSREAELPPQTALQCLRRDMTRFADHSGFAQDDQTVVMISLRPLRTEPRRGLHERRSPNYLSLPAAVESLPLLRHRLADFTAHWGREDAESLFLAVQEAATNALVHTEGGVGGESLDFRFVPQADGLVIEMFYLGHPVLLDLTVAPDFSGATSGGFGLYIMAELLDSIDYLAPTDGVVKTRLFKRFQPAVGEGSAGAGEHIEHANAHAGEQTGERSGGNGQHAGIANLHAGGEAGE